MEIVKQPECYWGFAYVHPRTEKKIAERLQNSGVRCYLPLVPHAYMMHRTKVVTQVPMFAGYLFLCVSREEATRIRYREKQIVRIELLFDELREAVLMKELKMLQQCEEQARTTPVFVNPGIAAGDEVLITGGSLKGLTTRVIRRADDQDMIVVNVTMLNQHLAFPVSAGDLKKITA